MGIETDRFVAKPHKSLKCPVCEKIFENPIRLVICGHGFCENCVNDSDQCKICGKAFRPSDHILPDPILREQISDMDVYCQYAPQCSVTDTLQRIDSHQAECQFNPNRLVLCAKACRRQIKASEVENHDCLHHLKELVEKIKPENQRLRDEHKRLETERNNSVRRLEELQQECKEIEDRAGSFPTTERVIIMFGGFRRSENVEFLPVGSNEWTVCTAMQLNFAKNFNFFATCQRRNKVFISGGQADPRTSRMMQTNLHLCWDLDNNHISLLPGLPTPRSHHASIIIDSCNTEFLFGGNTDYGDIDEIMTFKIAIKDFDKSSARLSRPKNNMSIGTINQEDVYLFGGETGADNLWNTIESFHVQESRCTLHQTTLPANLMLMGCAALNNAIYLMGGDQDRFRNRTDYNLRFDPRVKQVEQLQPMSKRKAGCSVLPIDNNLHVLSGGQADSRTSNGYEIYDVRADRWNDGPSMKSNRWMGGCCFFDPQRIEPVDETCALS